MDPVGSCTSDAAARAGGGPGSQPALVLIRPGTVDEEPEVAGRIAIAATARASTAGNALALGRSIQKACVERLVPIESHSHRESGSRCLGCILTHLLAQRTLANRQ